MSDISGVDLYRFIAIKTNLMQGYSTMITPVLDLEVNYFRELIDGPYDDFTLSVFVVKINRLLMEIMISSTLSSDYIVRWIPLEDLTSDEIEDIKNKVRAAVAKWRG